MARLVSHAQRPRLNAKAGDVVWCAENLLLYGEMRVLSIRNDWVECRLDMGSPRSSIELFRPGELVTDEELKKAA